MIAKKFKIMTKKTFTSEGKEKTHWNKVGEMVRFDNEDKYALDLHMFPNQKFFIFEEDDRDKVDFKRDNNN